MVNKIQAVSLSRGACYGACPIYEVILRRSGKATWVGEANTERLGSFRGTFQPETFMQLASFVERSGFFEWDEHYEPAYEITDGPTTAISVTRGRIGKTVEQYESDEPPDFWVLATLIDAIAREVEWTTQSVRGGDDGQADQ